jgi:hypothetical protein
MHCRMQSGIVFATRFPDTTFGDARRCSLAPHGTTSTLLETEPSAVRTDTR